MCTVVQPINCDYTVYLCVQEYSLSAVTVLYNYVFRSRACQQSLYSVPKCTGVQPISCDLNIRYIYIYSCTDYQL